MYSGDLADVSGRFKLLKWWAQSFLVGIPRVLCGFRDDDGKVGTIEELSVREMPHRAKVGTPAVRRRGRAFYGRASEKPWNASGREATTVEETGANSPAAAALSLATTRLGGASYRPS